MRAVAGLGLSGLFLYLAFRRTSFDDLFAAVRSANYWWLIPVFAILMASHVVRAVRWRLLLDPIKPRIGFRNLFSGVMIGYMMNNVLPRAGEIVRPYALGRLESIPASAALGTIVVERLMDILTFLALIVLLPFVYQGPLFTAFPWLERAGTILALVTLGLLGTLVLLMVRRDWTSRLLTVLNRILPHSTAARVTRIVHSFLDGFLFLKAPAKFLPIVTLSLVIWGLYLVMTYVSFLAFEFEHPLGLDAALVVLAISSIGVAIPAPGSTGTYHFFASQSLTALFGIGTGQALSFATVTHALGFVGVTLIGLYFFLRDHITLSDAVRERGPS